MSGPKKGGAYTTTSNGYSSSGGGSAGSGTSSFPDGFQCPQSEWWCESGDYRSIDGVWYTPESFPGMNDNFPWLWWENSLWIDNNLGITNSTQSSIWLFNHIERSVEIKNYLISTNTLSLNQKRSIVSQHIELMMNDTEYYSFVTSHNTSGLDGLVWWEDNSWISNPVNISFEIDEPQPAYELTAAEKNLVKQYPVHAYFIKRNATKAINETNIRFGTNGLNDKSDAFRHTFFNAINERDCGKENLTLTSIARKFSDAHESEVPASLQKEKDMDLFNNNVGHQIGDVFFPILTSDASLANEAWDKLISGLLRYLKPLNYVASPAYDANRDGIQDCPTCLNGIISTTVLTPTNQ